MNPINATRRRIRRIVVGVGALLVMGIGIVVGIGLTQGDRDEKIFDAIHVGMTDQEVWDVLYPGNICLPPFQGTDYNHGGIMPSSFPFVPSTVFLRFKNGRLETKELTKSQFWQTLEYWKTMIRTMTFYDPANSPYRSRK